MLLYIKLLFCLVASAQFFFAFVTCCEVEEEQQLAGAASDTPKER